MRLIERAGERPGEDGVGERGSERTVAGEPVSEAEDVVMQRMQAALVMLREELRFVGGHVHLNGALRLAGFATQAEVECFVHGLALESFFAQTPGKHLPEQVGAAARGVLLLAGGAIAGAHHAAAVLRHAPTPTQRSVACSSDPSSRRRRSGSPTRETGVRAVRSRLVSMDIDSVAQIFSRIVDAHGIGELAGIHAVVGIPQCLEFAERLDQLRAEHFGQQRGARLAVAMLAGERAAKCEHNVRRALNELAELAQSLSLRKSKLMRMCTQPWP